MQTLLAHRPAAAAWRHTSSAQRGGCHSAARYLVLTKVVAGGNYRPSSPTNGRPPSPNGSKKQLWIDCDAGIDDAQGMTHSVSHQVAFPDVSALRVCCRPWSQLTLLPCHYSSCRFAAGTGATQHRAHGYFLRRWQCGAYRLRMLAMLRCRSHLLLMFNLIIAFAALHLSAPMLHSRQFTTWVLPPRGLCCRLACNMLVETRRWLCTVNTHRLPAANCSTQSAST